MRIHVPWLLLLAREDRILVPPVKPALAKVTRRGQVGSMAGGHALHVDTSGSEVARRSDLDVSVEDQKALGRSSAVGHDYCGRRPWV